MTADHEHRIDLTVQMVGLAASLFGICFLLWVAALRGGGQVVAAVAIYGVTLVAMFVCSILNAKATATPTKDRWQIIDHAVIYLLIAGTYTPFCILVLGGRSGMVLMGGVWAAALLGVVSRVLLRRHLRQAIISLYVLLGWCGLVQIDTFLDRLPHHGLALLGIGGIIYTCAAPLHRFSRLRYHNALWHACVVVAAVCHWGAILVTLNALAGGV